LTTCRNLNSFQLGKNAQVHPLWVGVLIPFFVKRITLTHKRWASRRRGLPAVHNLRPW